MSQDTYPKVAQFKVAAAFRARLAALGLDLPCDDAVLSAAQHSPLAQPVDVGGFVVGNRWCIHPMEGWDGTPRGEPTDHTLRRWRHFGASGAKLIWGGEAFSVQSDARSNPRELAVVDGDLDRALRGMRRLHDAVVDTHRAAFGNADDLLVGLQLTHSGRFCKPNDDNRLEPRIAYHHPILDPKFEIAADDSSVLVSDDYLNRVIDNTIAAAGIAQQAGFGFVDVKHCHGYLGHELLSAFTRPGKYGGSFENRTRYARQIIEGIRAQCPGLMIGMRLSAFDGPPFKPDAAHSAPGRLGPGIPEDHAGLIPYVYGFGCNPSNPLEMDLREPIALINMLAGLGVRLINVSCGSPYYNPHIQRPAMFPPCDGYAPPEDPLVGVARQIDVVRELKEACPGSILVGTAYTYLQEYLPHVAQAVIRRGWTDFVGVGRLALSYWDLPADTLAGRPLQMKRLCRTFSDCTTAPRNGIRSGCYPLDEHYRESIEHPQLKSRKSALRDALKVVDSTPPH